MAKKHLLIVAACALAAWAATACGSKTPDEMLGDADELARSGDLPGAIEIVKKAKGMELDELAFCKACMMLGSLYVASGDFPAARTEFEGVFQRFGAENKNPEIAMMSRVAAVNIFRGFMEAKQPEKALEFAEKTADKLPPESELRKGMAFLASQALYEMGKHKEALEKVDSLLKAAKTPEEMAGLLPTASLLLSQQGRTDEAAQVYLDFLKKYPDPNAQPDLKREAGRIYLLNAKDKPDLAEKGKALFREALADYDALGQKAKDINEKADITVRKSLAAWALEEKTLAIDCLTSVTQTLAVRPDIRSQAMIGLAQCKADMGEKAEAKMLYEKILREFPNTEIAGQAIQDLQAMSLKEAEDALKGGASQPASGPGSRPAASKPAAAAAARPAEEPRPAR